MKKVLVAYSSNSGSTGEIAQAVARQFGQNGQPVDVKRLEEVTSLAEYEAVVVGAPMIFGWHRSALRFIRRFQNELSGMRVAYFCTLMRLTSLEPETGGVPAVCVDPGLAQPPKNPERLSIKERYASLPNYLRPILKAAPSVHPASIGFFGGKVELFRLKWWEMLFIMAVVQARPGDLRNWPFIQDWTAGLQKEWGFV